MAAAKVVLILVPNRSKFLSLLFSACLVFGVTSCRAQNAEAPANGLAPEARLRVAHTIRLFYRVPPQVGVEIKSATPSEFPGWTKLEVEFAAEDRRQTNTFLYSADGKKLMRFMPIDVAADPSAKIDLVGRPIRGSKDAKLTVIVFDDFQCPFCSLMHSALFPDVLREYDGKVRFIYKDFPLAEKHQWATRAAVDANCLLAQNNDAYWTFADYVHANQEAINGERGTPIEKSKHMLDEQARSTAAKLSLDATKLTACLLANDEKPVKASVAEGDALGVEATPTIYINGEKLEGAIPVPEFETVLDRSLQEMGVAPPVHPKREAEKKPEPAPPAPAAAPGKPPAAPATKPAK